MNIKMTHPRKSLLGAILALAAPFALPVAVRAADHGDAPTLAHDQGCDIADVFFFLDPNDNTKAIVIGTVRGFIVPGEAVNFGIFDPAIRYRFEFENTGDAKADRAIDVTFSARTAVPGPTGREALQVLQPQMATVKIPKVASVFNGGTFTASVLNPNFDPTPNTPVAATLSPGIQFFAGEVDDPFFFDIPGFARFIASVRRGTPDLTLLSRGRDSFGGYNILSIALSVPVNLLKGPDAKIGVRFFTQRHELETPTSKGKNKGVGPFVTVDSMGNPAVNVALLPFTRKNAYNAAPAAGLAKTKFAGDILATLAALGTTGVPTDPKTNLGTLAKIAVLTGDYLRLDPSVPNQPADKIGGGAPGQGNFFGNPAADGGTGGGRRLRDDTVDTLLQVITGLPTAGDGTSASISQFPQTATFPFLAPAQQPVASADPLNPTATDDKTQN